MKKLTAILTMLMLVVLSTEAQQNHRNIIELDWGLAHLTRQDLSYSPLIHRTTSLKNIQLQYQRKGDFDHRISARYGNFTKQTGKVSAFNSSQTISLRM